MQYFIGIDPGINGAIAIIHGVNSFKYHVFDIPKRKIIISKKKNKFDYDIMEMDKILKPYTGKNVESVLENVHSMPGQGVSSTFLFGRGKGIWEGLLAANGFCPELVTPLTWKKSFDDKLQIRGIQSVILEEFKVNNTKNLEDGELKKTEEYKKFASSYKARKKRESKRRARALASELFPDVSDQLTREKDDGRAEALLIAEYKRGKFINEKRKSK